ncbi:bifunctional 3,4-dihydroxy-2-butanone-4-phosphate synthase/GTP cyclohydrolase II [Inmirania thermothiophila]|uniref:3,4-dihydroxy-2-butanone 4-phosphate synthase n=1 Tax=Inmirania thermothiophila TaxID=1750597 RepID=A0A3N1Y812_9GAMM|nr:bifunctional 3,4-dihydroxy-2-butanone-4-phosphate synthase/GTP cyclohydrolase II [Inmirania thermothiophila]ROR34966.1 GTP cyclohydrolase II /3,4-dihydroxy-2-butanone 4-phosphate synthase [Inmirania thermothiophila]
MALNTIEEIIEDIRLGRMVIIMDDEDRENEGDLVMAAELVRPEDINFMARYGRGLICLTLTQERCRRLRLPLMVSDTHDKHATNFTVSIEAAHGVTTGISAYDRAVTIRTAVAPNARPEDLVQPGHVFPLMAQPGGVLTRAGHTEAGCDLARLAGLEPAAVIVEILNEDGTMARRPDLERFAAEHGLKIGTIADLIEYRLRNEKTVERVAECDLPTEHGRFRLVTYQDQVQGRLHFAAVLGEIRPEEPTLVRVQMRDTLCDLFQPLREDCGYPVSCALRRIAAEGKGVLVVLDREEDPRALVRRLRGYDLADRSGAVPEGPAAGGDLRGYGIGAQILADLGVHRMRVIAKTPRRVHALSGFNLEIVEYVSCE